MIKDAIGWASSLLLLATILSQILKQWRAGTSKGVSLYLFIGQFFASCGFTAYSIMVEDWVFTVTNGLMGLAATAGFSILMMHRRRDQREA